MTHYAIKERTDDEARNGPYIRLTLGNKSGTVKAVFWQVPDEVKAVAKVGAVVEVEGTLGEYKGEPQLNISALWPVPPEQIRHEDLLPASPNDAGGQEQNLDDFIAQVGSKPLREFLQATFYDLTLRTRFCRWPAAVSYHHSWVGGLLDHCLEVAGLAAEMVHHWPKLLDRDLLIAGALLHDIGKLEEIEVGASFEFTTQGRLAGHVALGMEWLATRQLRHPLPEAMYAELLHMIASHHGQQEWGAVTTPKTANAVALHLADLASSRMTAARQAIEGLHGTGGWTEWDKATRTHYYVPTPAP